MATSRLPCDRTQTSQRVHRTPGITIIGPGGQSDINTGNANGYLRPPPPLPSPPPLPPPPLPPPPPPPPTPPPLPLPP
uniref:Uncharacterized protein n=1 Tax=Vespula pensylvanica TaxID=30213 RepID=A0A834P1K5_VESPE|nr:hypothetical protein H0235_007660 [Vespula pensylvanica]